MEGFGIALTWTRIVEKWLNILQKSIIQNIIIQKSYDVNTTWLLKYVRPFFKIMDEKVKRLSVHILIYLNAFQYSAANAEIGYEREWEKVWDFFVKWVYW